MDWKVLEVSPLSLSFSLFLSASLSFSDYLPTYLLIYLSTYLSVCLSIYLSIYLAIHLSIDLSIYPSIHPSIYLSISLSVYLSTCLSVSLKTKLFCEMSSLFKVDNIKNEAILRDFLNVWTWQRQKRRNSARPLHFSKLTTEKTQQFSETSLIFAFDNIKIKAILRDFLKNGKLSAALTASYQCLLRFFHSTCLKYCACHEKVMPGHTKCCTCHAKSS